MWKSLNTTSTGNPGNLLSKALYRGSRCLEAINWNEERSLALERTESAITKSPNERRKMREFFNSIFKETEQAAQ